MSPEGPAPERPRVFAEQDMGEPEASAFGVGRAVVFSARCPGVERPNEDAAALIPYDARSGVLAVADGLGGQPAGGRAARMLLDCLGRRVSQAARSGSPLRAAVLDALEQANREIQELRVGAGTTLAALELHDGTVRPYHVGDSAVLVTGQRGRRRLLTVAHSPVGYGVEAGLLDEREAMEHHDRHLLSNLVGSPDMRIEVGTRLKLGALDTALIASDGLFDNLHTDEIIGVVRKGPLEQAARTLAGLAGERMRSAEPGSPQKPDDLTFVLYRAAPARRSSRRSAAA